MEANWPIRVGGEYRNKSGKNYSARITEIDGSDVYYTLVTHHSDGTNSVHCPSSTHVKVFRALYRPEDQSPIPQLVEALRAIYAGCVNKFDDERVLMNISVDAFRKMEAALAKADSTAVSENEGEHKMEVSNAL